MRFRTIALVGIILLAAFLRFYLLDTTPPALYPDEAMNGVNALRALERSDFRVFYPDNNGREGLFIDIQALSVQIFGPSAWALRAVAALAGTLTVLVFFFLAREIGLLLYGEKRQGTQRRDGTGEENNPFAALFREGSGRAELFAILATFLLAVSFWHINFSRIGFRAILLPLLASTAFFFLLRGLRTSRSGDFFASGLALGLSLSTYIASRVMPLLFFPFLLWDILGKRRSRVAFRWLLLLAGFTIAVFPLAGYFAAHPQDFLGRAGDVSIFSADDPIRALAESTGKTLLMFHVAGDGNWRHNVAGTPMLDPLTGLFFFLGFVIAAASIIRKIKLAPRVPAALLFILLWLSAGLLPEITTSEGIPHALRALNAIPPVMLLSALGATWLIWDAGRVRFPKAVTGAVIVTALMLVAIFNFHQYFLVWAGNPNVQGAFRADLAAIADYLNAHGDSKRYVIVNEGGVLIDDVPMAAATVKYLTADNRDIIYLTPDRVRDIEPEFDHTIIIPTQPPSQDLETALRATFPSLERRDDNGVIFYRL
ncbi:MAG: hypothetical protein HY475_02665 [Candidatus Terrybacteria bacterium]|nr:hypothetical protein [Candidatus Terrybacteria bacterium]